MPRFSAAAVRCGLRQLAAMCLCVAALAQPGDAATITITFTERSTDVLVSYAGQIDASAFGFSPVPVFTPVEPRINPSTGSLTFGTFAAGLDRYIQPGVTAPFGLGGLANGSMQTGDAFRLLFVNATALEVSLPQDYVPNTPISGSMVFAGSFLSLGIDPATTAFVSLPGNQQIRYAFEPYTAAIPLPATLPLLAGAFAVMGVALRRRGGTVR